MSKMIDISGIKYNSLLALNTYTRKTKYILWDFRCDCGNIKSINKYNVTKGIVTHCGCKNIETKGKHLIKSIDNIKYGRLTIIGNPFRKNNKYYCKFKCECGIEKIILKTTVMTGRTKSCGCLQKEAMKFQQRKFKIDREVAINRLFYLYKNGASKRKLEFLLSKEELTEFLIKNCYYCNIEPSQLLKIRKNEVLLYNGIDRIDNNVGYIIENCRTSCKSCNYAKKQMTEQEFYKWIERVYNHVSQF